MMAHKIFSICILFLLAFAFSAMADEITITGSQMDHAITDHWTDDSYNHPYFMWDDNWATYDYPVGFYEASVYWNATTNQTITDGIWRVKTSGGYEQNISLPSQCWGSTIILKATSHFVVGAKNFFSCYTSTLTWQLLASLDPTSAGISEQELILTTEAPAPLPTCQLTCPGDKCMFYDHMDYADSFTNCSYDMQPYLTGLVPTAWEGAGAVFYNADALDFFIHDINYAPNYYNDVYDSFSVFWGCAAGQCEPFYDASNQIQHQLIYQDSGTQQEYAAYDVLFYYDPPGTIYGYYLHPDNYYESFCTNCFEAYAGGHKIEILSFNSQQTSQSFFNATSGSLQLYKPNTITILIDSVAVAYDLPMAHPINSDQYAVLAKRTNYMIGQAVLLYNFEIRGNDLISPIQNGTGSKANYDYCTSASECLSQYCLNGRCQGKAGSEPCTANQQCASGTCSANKCTNPGIWAVIDSNAKLYAGTGSLDLTLVSIIVIILIFVGAVILAKGSIWGFAAGGAISFILLFFFTFAGWMAPFVFIAVIFLLALGVFGYLLLNKGGA